MNYYKILLSALFLTCTSFFAKSQNLISNGDFTANATNWTSTGTISYLTHNTTGNVMVLNNADAAGTYYVYQWVPATPGAVYTLNGVAATHAVTGTASIKMQFYAANQTTLLGTSSTNNITVSFNTSSWTAFPTLTYTAPANTAFIKVLGTSVNRALKWDNLVLTTPTVCNANITGLIFNDMVGTNDMTLTNGSTYYLSALPSSFNLEAVYTGTVESMRFTLSGSQSSTVTENTDPYNFPGTGTAWTYGAGNYTLLVEAFTADNCGGTLCTSQTFSFTIGTCNNVTSGGTIGYNEVLCGTSVDPSLIVNVTSPSGGNSATIEYLWLRSYDGGTTNTVISGATSSTYDPGVITQTTWYRRCSRRQGCTDYDGESNWIQKSLCPVPSVNAGTNQTKTCTTSSVSIGASSVSGLTYAWSPVNGLSSSTISNPNASPIATTTYTITATNACGCTATSTVTVNVNTTPPTSNAGPDQGICPLASVSIGTASIAGNSYSWSPASSLSAANIAQPIASPTATTSYTLTVTGTNGCTSSDVVLVSVNICTVSITGNVFEDNNGPTNVDGTGIGTPSGLPLYANLISATGTVIATTTVNANGTFTFLNVTPNANYTINTSITQGIIGNPAPSPLLPAGWYNVSEDCCDNTGNDGTTNGNVFVGVATSNVSNVNFGIRQPLSLGNLIWRDINRNGIKEVLEPGISNASINLYEDANSDGIPDGTAIQTIVSDSLGGYIFNGLKAGNYIVGVIPPTGNVYTSSVNGEELNPNNDVDLNDNGIVTISGETRSGTITLTAGLEPLGESSNVSSVMDANENLTLDFGFFVCPTSFITPNAYACAGNPIDLTAFETPNYTGGVWSQGGNNLSSTVVGPGTYTYTFSNGTCTSNGLFTIEDNIPDYTPSISIAPNAITGITNMRIILTITELLNRTPCSDVYVFVPRLEPRFTMSYEPTATIVGGVPVNNNDWQYFNTNPNFYVWKFIGAAAFPGGSDSKIGFLGNYDPSQTDGETSFNVQIFQGSGGELNITNNTDSEILLYFR